MTFHPTPKLLQRAAASIKGWDSCIPNHAEIGGSGDLRSKGDKSFDGALSQTEVKQSYFLNHFVCPVTLSALTGRTPCTPNHEDLQCVINPKRQERSVRTVYERLRNYLPCISFFIMDRDISSETSRPILNPEPQNLWKQTLHPKP